jgi:outer membrane cobalamin receptor
MSAPSPHRSRAAALLVLGFVACPALAGNVNAPALPQLDQSLAQALNELRRDGLHILYSNDLVTADLRVIAEPQSAAALDVAREILGQHGLALVHGPAGRWLVVRGEPRTPDTGRQAVQSGGETELQALDAITVTAGRYTLGDPENSQYLSRIEIERTPHLADDPLRMVRQLPGITGNDFSAGLHVRGGARDETAILVDGVRIHDPFHLKDLQGALGLLDAGVVENIDVLTGGFGAEYGDRMSAMVSMHTLVPNEQPQTSIGVSFVNAYVRSQGPIRDGQGHWLASVRRGYLDWLFQLINSDGDFTPRYWDAFGKVDWMVGDATLVTGNVLLARDELRFVDTGGDIKLSLGTADSAYGWMTAGTQWSRALASDTVVSISSIDRKRDNSDLEDGLSADVHDTRRFDFAALRSDWRWQVSRATLMQWGIEATHTAASYRYDLASCISDPFPSGPCSIDRSRSASVDISGESIGAYVSARWRASPRVTGEFGVRTDLQSYTGNSQGETSPRIGLRFDLNDANTFRLGWGDYYQSQQPEELQVEDGETQLARAEHAEHRVASWDLRLRNSLKMRAELFDKRYGDLRTRYENQFDPYEVIPEARPDRIAVSPDSARAYGAEISVANPPEREFSWRLAYGYLDAHDSFADGEQPRSWSQTHSVTGSANWAFNSWNLNVFGTYHTGWPRTPLSVDASLGPTGIVEQPLVGERNSSQYPHYVRMDIRLSRTRQLANGELGYFFELYNFTDHGNPCCVGDVQVVQNPDGTLGTRVNYDDWLPLLPSFGFHWTFR